MIESLSEHNGKLLLCYHHLHQHQILALSRSRVAHDDSLVAFKVIVGTMFAAIIIHYSFLNKKKRSREVELHKREKVIVIHSERPRLLMSETAALAVASRQMITST